MTNEKPKYYIDNVEINRDERLPTNKRGVTIPRYGTIKGSDALYDWKTGRCVFPRRGPSKVPLVPPKRRQVSRYSALVTLGEMPRFPHL